MDKDTRNRIQRATQAARELLEHEYAEQLEGVFDIRLDGTIAAEPGAHLDAAQRVLRTKLVTAVEHQRASGTTKADAVGAYLREAAFTTLNRFVALKMLEARELVQECISRGDQSAGFKEFTGLASGLVQLPDHGYRIYIESIFDEIGREVRVLFDRRDPASLLWPRRQGLLDLLGILNASDLGPVWGEDETIGWVYQYFNSDDERKEMRAESQAPRNSRELAVRNQFFTPRYVVQFLTDNTLGRIWYEMRQGDTRLRDLEYLVRRPHEVFLAEGNEPPAEATTGDEDLTQEELLQHPVHVPFRRKKDPRDIRVLDPACGSGHFLLYAFDLLLAVYEEAWADEASPASEATGRPLRDDYPEVERLRTGVPELILRHNLHGIDIDARCTQIAALALWMRAQRTYRDLDIPCDARPPIQRTNIVIAEPMPGDAELRREFVATLDPGLGKLVERIFDQMELAGEVGSLLRIEDDIRTAVREGLSDHGELFRSTDEERWQRAEEELLGALQTYGEHATNGSTYRRRLFAEDASSGFAFIDACRRRYECVIMNPPFGGPTPAGKPLVRGCFPQAVRELALCMLEAALRRVVPDGRVGCLASRTPFFIASGEAWRREYGVSEGSVDPWADLGLGVLDDATVEVAALVIGRPQAANRSLAPICIRASVDSRAGKSKQEVLQSVVSAVRLGVGPDDEHVLFLPSWRHLATVPRAAFVYWMSRGAYEVLSNSPTLDPDVGTAKQGCSTSDDFRFVRLWWEVPAEAMKDGERYCTFAKGGTSSQFFDNYDFVINYADDGKELKAFVDAKTAQIFGRGDWSRWINSVEYYFRPGLAFARRTKRFCVYPLPAGAVFSAAGQAIFLHDDRLLLPALGMLNSKPMNFLLQGFLGRFELEPQYEVGVVQELPWPVMNVEQRNRLEGLAIRAWNAARHLGARVETSRLFCFPAEVESVLRDETVGANEQERVELRESAAEVDEVAARVFKFDEETMALADELVAPPPWSEAGPSTTGPTDRARPVLSWLFGIAMQRWCISQASAVSESASPFDALPWRPPAMEGRAIGTDILVDDPGHEADVIHTIALAASNYLARDADEHLPVEDIFSPLLHENLRSYIASSFFDEHRATYSRRSRRAPVYWQLATPSSSYSVWLYYHRFTRDTFYRALNDYVTPKLKHEERKLTSLSQDGGANPSASQRNQIDVQDHFVSELRALQEEVARVAPLWSPDLNDGVIINFAPLWRLVGQNRSWQKECRSTWDKLCKGDYDWAHLAMHLWPERVVPNCAEDRSLAIAHGLEGFFWYEDSDGKWQPRKVAQDEIDKLVKERTSAAVKDALKSLLEAPAPAPATGRTTRRKAPRAKGTRKKTASGRPKAATNGASSPSRSSAAMDGELLSKVKEAIGANGDGTSKADVIDATGISAGEWSKAIKTLLADGSVTQTGERRAARYHLAGGDA